MSDQCQLLDCSVMSEAAIRHMLEEHCIVLTVEEVLKIQNDILKRPPTLAECVLWSIQGSEHCSYKSTRHYLSQLNTQASNVILGPKEDAGIVSVAVDDAGLRYGIVMSHESHNHPSQIVPFEGAATGVGGNVRDVSCMGAEVIAIADSLRFGSIDVAKTQWIHEGVVSGIGAYGNVLGVPNIGGDLYYDEDYNEHCLVTVVTLGAICERDIIHSYAPADADDFDLILVGKPTDNSGFGGASFASIELAEGQANKGAVQEPNAFLGQHLLRANNALFAWLRKKKWIHRVGFKDLGAGGIACASVELADGAGYGADVFLDDVHTSCPDLAAEVILCAETQERYMWVSPPDLTEVILKHYNEKYDLPGVSAGSCASVVGKIKNTGQFRVFSQGDTIVNAKAKAITEGIRYDRPATPKKSVCQEPKIALPEDANDILLRLLAHENIASRSKIFEGYDKQVQGRTVLEAGVSDAGVLQPFNNSDYPEEIRATGVALSVDHNPRYNKIDAYWGAVNAVVEAVRNVAAVGASPQAITDCLCFANPEKPEHMWQFSEAIRGIADACAAFYLRDSVNSTLPVIGGNVSLYNESEKGCIPPSPIIACLGKLSDSRIALSKHFKSDHSVLVLVGERKDECGGSVYYQLFNELGANVPKPNLELVNRQVTVMSDLAERGLVLAAHDISDGGLAVALAEMSIPSDIGFDVEVPGSLPFDKLLFSETGGFVLEVADEHLPMVEDIFAHYDCDSFVIGRTNVDKRLRMQQCIDLSIVFAKRAWSQGLRERLL
jgi:phosphoribosylformylglycinamidine synthase II